MSPSYGGPPRVVARLSAALASLGAETTIASFGDDGQRVELNSMTDHIPGFERVKRVSLGRGGRWRQSVLLTWAPKLAGMVSRSDVVHLHDVWCPVHLVAGAMARHYRRPYFVQPNGSLHEWAMKQKRLKKWLAMRLAFRLLLDRSDALVLGNVDERDAVDLLHLKAGSVIVPLNGMTDEEMRDVPPPGGFHRRFPALNGRPYALFMGRFHYMKGLDYLADAFVLFARENKVVDLVLVGFDEGAFGDFERRVRSGGAAERVHAVGQLHDVAKWEAFRDAQCFVLPSRREGFSIAITEALACGVPAVISRDCHFSDAARAGAAIEVDLDPSAIAGAMLKICSDAALRRRMSEKARNLILKDYDCNVAARRLLQTYTASVEARLVAERKSEV